MFKERFNNLYEKFVDEEENKDTEKQEDDKKKEESGGVLSIPYSLCH